MLKTWYKQENVNYLISNFYSDYTLAIFFDIELNKIYYNSFHLFLFAIFSMATTE